MQSFSRGFQLASRRVLSSSHVGGVKFIGSPDCSELLFQSFDKLVVPSSLGFMRLFQTGSYNKGSLFETSNNGLMHPLAMLNKNSGFLHASSSETLRIRCFSTEADKSGAPIAEDNNVLPPRIKFKRPDKMARHIMQILDREAVQEVKIKREMPDIQPGYIIQMKVEVPENKRRLSTVKGIVIARRNAGLNSTFRVRRLVAGVGVESLFPLYSPNIKEIKILDKKKVRRAKLYYLRDKMNPLKK